MRLKPPAFAGPDSFEIAVQLSDGSVRAPSAASHRLLHTRGTESCIPRVLPGMLEKAAVSLPKFLFIDAEIVPMDQSFQTNIGARPDPESFGKRFLVALAAFKPLETATPALKALAD